MMYPARIPSCALPPIVRCSKLILKAGPKAYEKTCPPHSRAAIRVVQHVVEVARIALTLDVQLKPAPTDSEQRIGVQAGRWEEQVAEIEEAVASGQGYVPALSGPVTREEGVSFPTQKKTIGHDAVAAPAEGNRLRRKFGVPGPAEPIVEGSEISKLGADGKKPASFRCGRR